MLGAYYLFRRRLPGLLSDDDVPHLLRWALPADPGQPGGPAPRAREAGSHGMTVTWPKACWTGPSPARTPMLSSARPPPWRPAACETAGTCPIPAALDDRDAAGALTGESRRLRRLLAARLLSDQDAGLAVHQLIWGWQPSRPAQERDTEALRRGERPSLPSRLGLLGPADLRWALEAAAAAGPEKTDTWIAVLRGIWDPQDRDAQDAAWQVRDTPLWAAFSASFDPVVLGSEAEAVQRSIFDAHAAAPVRVGGRGGARRRGP